MLPDFDPSVDLDGNMGKGARAFRAHELDAPSSFYARKVKWHLGNIPRAKSELSGTTAPRCRFRARGAPNVGTG
jgi:hypothetical protein